MKSPRLLVWLAVFLGTALCSSVWAEGGKSLNTNEPAVNPDPQHLVWIRPGAFTMGSPTNDVESSRVEHPPTVVTISQGFWMAKLEATQGQYQAVMGTNPSFSKWSTNLPVEKVSWVDATNFCAKLTERERQAGRLPAVYAYRLPTEAEWEYACRAGTTTQFSFGDDPGYIQLGEYAWHHGNVGRTATHPVATRRSNPWGLYDMHGNVREWCQDWEGDYKGGSVTNPIGASSGSYRVLRGGSWAELARDCRTASRDYSPPVNRSRDLGFRPVLAPGR